MARKFFKQRSAFGKPIFLTKALSKWSKKIPDKMWILVRLRKEWRNIFYNQIGEHTWPDSIQNYQLKINVDDPIWIQELSLMHDEVYTSIRSYLRDERFFKLIRKLRFQNGEVKHENVKTEDLTVYLDQETQDRIFRETSRIKDPELREALNYYLMQCSLIPVKKKYLQQSED